jgi:hypothetical protein
MVALEVPEDVELGDHILHIIMSELKSQVRREHQKTLLEVY